MTIIDKANWKIEDLPWDQFDASKIDPELLKIVKAAALVEYNAHDYAAYLANVFPDDPEFCQASQEWSEEETQHGAALGAWARKADPIFDFDGAFKRYKEGYQINVEAQGSIRGSRAGELIARCIVETGTSSYYTALGDAAQEPVLKAICRAIAADELRHYKLFHKHLQRYLEKEGLTRYERLKIGLARVQESEDDELAFAYYAANASADAIYDLKTYSSAYMVRAFPLYRPENLERVVAMVFRACGFTLPTWPRKLIKNAASVAMRVKVRRAHQALQAANADWMDVREAA